MTSPVKGAKRSPNDDELCGRSSQRVSDRIYGLDGEDVIDASTFSHDRDVVEGGRKDDRDSNICFVDPGDVSSSCQRRGGSDPASIPRQESPKGVLVPEGPEAEDDVESMSSFSRGLRRDGPVSSFYGLQSFS